MKFYFTLLIVFSSFATIAQHVAEVTIYNEEVADDVEYKVELFTENKLILDTLCFGDEVLIIDQLKEKTTYQLIVTSSDTSSFTTQQTTAFFIDSSDVSITIAFANEYYDLNNKQSSLHEQGFYGHFINNGWFSASTPLTLSTGIGVFACDYVNWTKNLSAAIAFGGNITHESFTTDTTFSLHNGTKKRYENYTYLGLFLEPKIRLHGKAISAKNNGYKGPLLDLGVKYQLPLLFQHRTLYPNKELLVEKRIHSFSDVRLTATLGIQNVAIYANYRVFKLVEKSNLPNPTPWQFGVVYRVVY